MKPPVRPFIIPESKKDKHAWKYIIAGMLLLIFHNFFGAVTYNAFVLIDHAFRLSGANSPVFIWSCFGLLMGAVVGIVVATKKFKLDKKISLFAGIPVALLIVGLLLASGPYGQISPRPEELSAKEENNNQLVDSSQLSVAAKTQIQPKKRSKLLIKKIQQKAEQNLPKRESCEEKLTGVSVTVRSDSVRLFFRTTQENGGEWSRWESIFIPQPGQYGLSGSGGKVIANGIQYYYEVKQIATRSASDPFSKSLCNGPLTIDTY
ncbi:hypothetical protein EV200_101675 [Pedobacter psychrotolerans]|uniref:Uncharacterized protein n=1 Tax=Pedobacter psychrotolerans TaxID=1843235 RepID=A0A4R2HLZ3_9SPHI|nr:hypothetical protein [Pedobacter psychrotolerans]TCO31227.1 hypothetical protein EV200_101675 [Pedobacter psychrotolerans]GGE41249.1 hypothetical protein GCM10011413_03920 [Pedobacter psychrotolerans]